MKSVLAYFPNKDSEAQCELIYPITISKIRQGIYIQASKACAISIV